MADVEAAIAAAISAAAPGTPPKSPIVKAEPYSGDSMAADRDSHLLPAHSPQSALKRSWASNDTNGVEIGEHREEKRIKIESSAEEDIDEIARMVQAVQASVMKEFLSTPGPIPDPQLLPELQSDQRPELQPETQAELQPKIEPMSKDHIERSHEVFETTEHEQANIGSPMEIAPDQRRSPSTDMEGEPDTLWHNPRYYTRRKHILPALGALAVDILIALSEQTLEDTVATLTSDIDSDIAKEYGVLRAAFNLQRRQLSHPQEAPRFLDAGKLGIKDQMSEVIRIANLAATCASIFGTNEITLEEVNNHFLDIFVPKGKPLTHDAAELYLGLKTQLFLAVLEGHLDKTREQLLEELFVTDVEHSLQAHHPNLPLTTSELDFIANSKSRGAMLSRLVTGGLDALSKRFTYEAFLDNLSTYLNDNINSIQAQVLARTEAKGLAESPAPIDMGMDDLSSEFDLNAAIAEASRAAAQDALQSSDIEDRTFEDLSAFLTENVSRAVEQSRQVATSTDLPSSVASAAESASKATALALESIARNQYQPTALPHTTTQSQPTVNHHNYQPQQTEASQFFSSPQQHQHQHQHQQQAATNIQGSYQTTSGHLPPNQSDSTPALYERARQAAAARSSTHARREGSHSTRRPWSPEEEKALMMGLDMVKGPHWSQILSLFGPNGSISQILADRTQVQLKDKARNLKLFFLKTNSEMPYYLQCVTGELKTRAPTQAARKEAEEKARMNSEEHQAHMNGILALAGGLQNHTAQRSVPSGVTPNSTTTHKPPHTSPSKQDAPAISRQISQPMVSAQPARPVIPAPQPVSLPTLTPTGQQHHLQPAPIQRSTPRPETSSLLQTSPKPEPATEPSAAIPKVATMPAMPDHSGLSIEDQALLSLKAAMEGESSAAATHSATPHINQGEYAGQKDASIP
ncbi:hypothetical protein GGR50DRAFT_144505 [Xylaria sp. CBS 124048]|nr:hypothetical protein GGR50DRAFT_144505 [Xylaria sp. CBS 124048]